MRDICEIKEFTGELEQPSIKSMLLSTPISGKEKILKYLRSFESVAAAGMSLMDEITGQNTGEGVSAYEDNDWSWDDRMIYHFERYNMKLSDDFIDYVLSKKEA